MMSKIAEGELYKDSSPSFFSPFFSFFRRKNVSLVGFHPLNLYISRLGRGCGEIKSKQRRNNRTDQLLTWHFVALNNRTDQLTWHFVALIRNLRNASNAANCRQMYAVPEQIKHTVY